MTFKGGDVLPELLVAERRIVELEQENAGLRASIEGYEKLVAALLEKARQKTAVPAARSEREESEYYNQRRMELFESLTPGQWFVATDLGEATNSQTRRDDLRALVKQGALWCRSVESPDNGQLCSEYFRPLSGEFNPHLPDHEQRRKAFLDSLVPGEWFRPRDVGVKVGNAIVWDDIRALHRDGSLVRRARQNGARTMYEYCRPKEGPQP